MKFKAEYFSLNQGLQIEIPIFHGAECLQLLLCLSILKEQPHTFIQNYLYFRLGEQQQKEEKYGLL